MNANNIFKRYADNIFKSDSFKDKILLEKSAALDFDEFPNKEELRRLIHKENKYPEIIGTHPDFAYLENEEGKEYHYAVSVFIDIKGSTLLSAKLPLEDVKVIKNNIITNAIVFLPKISNPSLLNFVDRIGFKMIPVEKYRKLQTEEKGIRKVFS